MSYEPVAQFPKENPIVTLSKATDAVYLLEMHALPDNRLTPTMFHEGLFPAYDYLMNVFLEKYDEGSTEMALVIAGKTDKDKFFSNGLELKYMGTDPNYFRDFYRLLARTAILPFPVVTAINGHAFAGGFMFSMAADYRVMKKDRTWLCLNELDFGAPVPYEMMEIIRCRITPQVLRKIVLQAHRFTSDEALASGIVDSIVDGDGRKTVEEAIAFADSQKHRASAAFMQCKVALIWPSLKILNGRLPSEISSIFNADAYFNVQKLYLQKNLTAPPRLTHL